MVIFIITSDKMKMRLLLYEIRNFPDVEVFTYLSPDVVNRKVPADLIFCDQKTNIQELDVINDHTSLVPLDSVFTSIKPLILDKNKLEHLLQFKKMGGHNENPSAYSG
jgi:hypothetical protein